MKNKKQIIIFVTAVLVTVLFSIFYLAQIKKEETQNKNTIDNNIQQENIVENNIQQANTEETSQIQQELENTELFGAYYSLAEEIMKNMTLEEKVGQMFLVRYPRTNSAITQIKEQNPGGYVLFAVNFDNQTPQSIKQELEKNQENSKIPMFFAVDEEGGKVVRVSSHSAFRTSSFLSPQDLYKEGGLERIAQDAKEKSQLLKSIGLNMNLAPVADVSTSSSNFIYARSFGKGAEETATYVTKVIETMKEEKIVSSMKHFPGYGNNKDTHTGIAIDQRPYETFTTSDFLPFEAGIKIGAPTIMVSHNVVESMDKNYPASLSKEVHKILREDLNFSGLIITDDLAMDAVKQYVENKKAAVQAVKAGNDMLISSNFEEEKQQVLNAIATGEISEETINTAVRRILACKLAYGIIL